MEMEEKQIHTIIVNKVSIIYLHKKKKHETNTFQSRMFSDHTLKIDHNYNMYILV